MTYLEEYYDLIKRREIIVGHWIKAEVRNLIEDLQDPRYIYDTTEAHKRIKFAETLCFQSKAPYYMKPLVLMPWQKAFWEAVYSFRMADTGLRRFTEGLLEIARKNGKSTMFAADCMYDLFVGEGGNDICCASNSNDQALLIFNEIAGMAARLDPHEVLTHKNNSAIVNKLKNISVTKMASKTVGKDGKNLSKSYMDESHDVKEANGESTVAESCKRSMSGKEEPLFLNCSTQGFNRDCYLDKKIETAKKIIRGEIVNIHFIAFLFEQDSESEVWQDKKMWVKSNPALMYGVKKWSYLEQNIEDAKHDKATRVHMLTKDFNIPQSNAQSWLLLEDYDYPMKAVDPEMFRGSFILGSVDLAATTDLTSAKALIMLPNSNTKFILSHYWIPSSKLEDSDDKEAGANYSEWAKQGYLTVHEGNEVEISEVADWYYKLFSDLGLKPYKIGYDQRFSKTFCDRCEEYGFDTVRLDQGRALSLAMKLTEADLKSKIFNYDNPIDKWCLSNCCCKVDNAGDIQPVKIPGQKSRRIDGALTFIMLNEMYRRYKAEYKTLIGAD